ncbi:MAG: hypothetical protein ACREJ5_26565 [Geminicoccaceae bacterium]
MIIVVDASVLGHWLLTTRPPPHLLLEQFNGDASMSAPHLIDAEVGHLLRRHTLVGISLSCTCPGRAGGFSD